MSDDDDFSDADEQYQDDGEDEEFEEKKSKSKSKKAEPKKEATIKGTKRKTPEKDSASSSSSSAAPKPKKQKTAPAADAKTAVLNYMRTTNRPYSDKNVYDNLRGAVSKKAVTQCLDELTAEGLLQRKEFKKTKIYTANQTAAAAAVEESSNAEDEKQIEDLSTTIEQLREEVKQLQRECDTLASQPTTADLNGRMQQLTTEIAAKRERLTGIQSNAAAVDKQAFSEAKEQCSKYLKLWKRRKAACMDIVSSILGEESTKTPGEMLEDLGCETDKDQGVDPATFSKLLSS